MWPITFVGNPQMGKGIGWQSQWLASSGQLHCSCWEGEPNYGCRFNCAILPLFLKLLINTSFQAKMWCLTSQPPWLQAETKWLVFCQMQWPLCTGGPALAELLSTKKLSDVIALHFWPIQDILSLKTWLTEPVEIFFLFQPKFHHHFFLLKCYTKKSLWY